MTGEESELYAPFLMMISNIKVLDDKLSIECISQPLMWMNFTYDLNKYWEDSLWIHPTQERTEIYCM